MIRLILVRHGNTFEAHQTPVQIGARTDLPLTEKGRLQAEEMARFLQAGGIRPAAFYRGPLKRQAETARILAAPFQMQDRIEPVLTEIDYGPWEGLTAEQIAQKWPEAYSDWTERSFWPQEIFKGNPPSQAIEDWLLRLRAAHQPGETVLAVSSNGLIRYFYSFEKEKWKKLVAHRQMEAIKVKTGHFCDLLLCDGRIEIKSWNQRPTILHSNGRA